MAIASEQDIPNRPAEQSEQWTFRRLFPFSGAVSSLTKAFANPFDVLLGYMVLVGGAAELIGHPMSWYFWVFAVLILISDLLERRTGFPLQSVTEKEEK